jgi:hypothetical protein
MPFEELTTQLTTRRTITKTGVKLAYAAPLVAASMKLGTSAAGAASPTCVAGGTCGGSPTGCNGDGSCSCGATADGSTACFQWDVAGSGGSCAGTGTCPSGEACILGTCLGDYCQPLCGAGGAAADGVRPNTP